MTPAVFVNDVVIGGNPRPQRPLRRFWNRPVMYSIPSGLLRPGGNVIDIRLTANGAWGRLTEIYLGPEQVLRAPYAQRFFWRVTFLNATTLGSLMIGVFMGIIGFAKRDPVYYWFAAFALAWHLQNLFTLTVDVPVDNSLWDLFAYLIVGLLVTTGSMFTFRFLGRRHPGWERLLTAMCVAGPALLVPLLLLDVETFNAVGSMIWLAGLLALSSCPVILMARALLERRDLEVFVLSVCYLLTVMLGAHDWLVTAGLGHRHDGMLMQFAAAPTLTAFGIILLRRFILALEETDLLNRELERRVEQKAIEIEASFRRNRELQSAQALSCERERIMRDMHDGFGSRMIGTLSRLDERHPRDREIAVELRQALHDLRLMIDSLDDVESDVLVALGLFRNRIQPQLDAVGLALNWHVRDLPPVGELGPERVLHLLRILQEAVTNCLRHARARSITFTTRSRETVNGRPCVCVVVADDGCGFTADTPRGHGLANMAFRAAEAGLELEITSTPSGTVIRLGFPREDPLAN